MTLTEVDTLRKEDPERLYTFVLFLIAKAKKEQEAMKELKDKVDGRLSGDSGMSDTFTIRIPDNIPEDHVSEIEEMKE